jgi:Protein of unknown function (DUF3800)
MAMFAFIDDSGSSAGEPVYVLGGLVAFTDTWEVFAGDWHHVLKAHPPIEYFKASEVWDQSKGEFAAFTTAERMAKVEALADVIFTYKPLAIACRLEWSTFKRFRAAYPLIEDLDDPYVFLFFACIAQMATIAEEVPKFTGVNFIFDGQNKIGRNVRLWYLVFYQRCAERLRSLLSPNLPEFEDEKIVLPLQGADMFAWYRRRSVLNSLGHESHQRLWKRFEPLCHSVILDECHLVKIANDLSLLASFYETNCLGI